MENVVYNKTQTSVGTIEILGKYYLHLEVLTGKITNAELCAVPYHTAHGVLNSPLLTK